MREFAGPWVATYGWVAAPTATGFLGGHFDHPFSRTNHESKPPTHTPNCWGSRMFGVTAIFPFSSIVIRWPRNQCEFLGLLLIIGVLGFHDVSL